ncbi:MAG: hypothetical protein AAFX87_04745 [Bacteroidota bacterium]
MSHNLKSRKVIRLIKIVLLSGTLLFTSLIGGYIIYEWYIGTHYYSFRLSEDVDVKLVADECSDCFLDWPIEFKLKVKDLKKGRTSSYHFETGEGPQLQFYFNEEYPEQLLKGTSTMNVWAGKSVLKKKQSKASIPVTHQAWKVTGFSTS